MTASATIGRLFDEGPGQWGLRGDPYLWRALQAHFDDTPLPNDADALTATIAQAYEQLSGLPLAHEQPFHVAAFAHGGMSSGGIYPPFWRDKALPLLRDRYLRAMASPVDEASPPSR